MKPKNVWAMLKETYTAWSHDDVNAYAAAVAYFTVFSLAPLLIIAIAIAGFFFGQQSAQEKLMGQLQQMMGAQGAEAIQRMIQGFYKRESGTIAAAIGVVTLLLGATRVFGELKMMLNRIWGVGEPTGGGVVGYLKQQVVLYLMVLVIGVLLLALLVSSAVLSFIGGHAGQMAGMSVLLQWGDIVLSIAVATALFAVIFKYLPDTQVAWRDVWVGALVTAILFTIGKYLIGLYLGRGSVASPYGAAGSLVILLLWFYYSAMIFFVGAEFTEVYSRRCGSQFVSGEPCERKRGERGAAESHGEDRTRGHEADVGVASDAGGGHPALPGGGWLILGLAGFYTVKRWVGRAPRKI